MKKVFIFAVLLTAIFFLSCSTSQNNLIYDGDGAAVAEAGEHPTSEITSALPETQETSQEIPAQTESETTASPADEPDLPVVPVKIVDDVRGLIFSTGSIPRNVPVITVDEDKKFTSTRIIDPGKPMVALTFDDGPSGYTEEIVDKLNEYNSAATFFVVGTQIKRYADILKYAVESGSEIGNHTAAHADLALLDIYQIDGAIMEVQESIYSITGVYPTLVRPPYGSVNDFVKESVMFPLMMWSVDTLDWMYRDPQRISDYIMEHISDGAVILLHDSRETTKDAMLITIERIISEGYQLVTVSELFQAKNITLEPGNIYRYAK